MLTVNCVAEIGCSEYKLVNLKKQTNVKGAHSVSVRVFALMISRQNYFNPVKLMLRFSHSVRSFLIASFISELTPEHSGVDKDKGQPCDSTDRMEESKQSDSSSVKETELQPENFLQTKENKISQSENINKRSRKKSCKAKRTHKKRKNSMKKSLFARFVGSHVQKKQQGNIF